MMMERPGLCHLIDQTYLEKVTKGYLSTTRGSEMAAKRSALGVILPPPRLSCEGLGRVDLLNTASTRLEYGVPNKNDFCCFKCHLVVLNLSFNCNVSLQYSTLIRAYE